MNSINIRTLRQQTRQVMDRVSMGETLEIRNHKTIVAVLHPPPPESASAPSSCFPDYTARLKKKFGNKCLEPDATSLIAEDRGDR